ncbi:hypothetical protein F4780DRAFT_749941 [Xylariomycetidae sp. FL0641]|nr:hypothetical protein F4780DRAFT_749941 [Xylariomycetidae sp. FL0641]
MASSWLQFHLFFPLLRHPLPAVAKHHLNKQTYPEPCRTQVWDAHSLFPHRGRASALANYIYLSGTHLAIYTKPTTPYRPRHSIGNNGALNLNPHELPS